MEDGLLAFYSPDVFLRTGDTIDLVETKAQGQLKTPNIQWKQRAAAAWFDRINKLDDEHRSDLPWYNVLLDEQTFYDRRNKGGSVGELLAYAKLRPVIEITQARFVF
jgi:type III restriction enzyme